MVLNDFQRGKLPYYVKPAECEKDEGSDDLPTAKDLAEPKSSITKEEKEQEKEHEEVAQDEAQKQITSDNPRKKMKKKN